MKQLRHAFINSETHTEYLHRFRGRRRFLLHVSNKQSALGSDLGTEDSKHERYWDHCHRNATKERPRPLYSKVLEHLNRK